MRISVLLTLAALLAGAATTQAQDGPRQLNTQPMLLPPDTVRRAPAAASEATSTTTPATTPAPVPAAALPPAPAPGFRVGLKSGQELRATDVEVRSPFLGRDYLLLNGEQKQELDGVRYFEDESGFYVRTNLPGQKRESTVRRDRTGRISIYSITRTQYQSSGFGPYGYGMGRFGTPYGMGNGGYRNTVRTEYFSKDNGPLQDMSLRNLAVATADKPAARVFLDQARRAKTAIALSYVGVGGLMVAGLYSTLSGTSRGISPLVYAAPVLSIVPLVLQGKQQRSIRQAIGVYNAQP